MKQYLFKVQYQYLFKVQYFAEINIFNIFLLNGPSFPGTDLSLLTLGSNYFHIHTVSLIIPMSHKYPSPSAHHLTPVTKWVLEILEGTSSQKEGGQLETSLQKNQIVPPGEGKCFEEAAVAMQSLWIKTKQPGLLHTACLTDTKSS